METANVVVRPLSPLGAEISGIDLREELPDSIKRQLVDAYNTYAMLVFHDQELTTEAQLRVTSIFGKISEQGAAPGGINFVTSLAQRGVQEGKMNLYSVGELKFHFGHSFHYDPIKGVMLYAMELPAPGSGGDTLFADSRLAYKSLPDALRKRIDGLTIRHRSTVADTSKFADLPLAYTHPDTGERFIYLSHRHADCIIGLEPDESKALIEELATYIEDQPAIQYRHVWKLKDLVVWDNLRTQHARTHYDPSLRRHLQRTQFE